VTWIRSLKLIAPLLLGLMASIKSKIHGCMISKKNIRMVLDMSSFLS
jgi:hypothetical protein